MDKAAFYQGVQEALEKVRDPIQLASVPVGRVLLPDSYSTDGLFPTFCSDRSLNWSRRIARPARGPIVGIGY